MREVEEEMKNNAIQTEFIEYETKTKQSRKQLPNLKEEKEIKV